MRLIIYTLLLTLAFASCRKEISNIPARPEQYGNDNFSQIFDAFWNGMNVNYVMWDIDSTNWDDVYKKYKPLFAALDMNKADDNIKANQYFREMLRHIQDGHLWLTRKYWDGARYDTFVYAPVTERQKTRSDYHDSIPVSHFDSTIPGNYLNPGYKKGFVPHDPNNPNSFGDVIVISGELRSKPILYLYISSFQLKSLYSMADSNTVKAALQHFFDTLNNLPERIKGLIIDVRGNGGGNTDDLDFIVGRLIGQKYVYGYNRYKNGNGRLDFGPWVPAYVNPPAGAKAFNKPVIVLADIFTGSMAEATTMAVKAMPNGTVVGERTFGRLSAILDNINANGGKFTFEGGNSSMSVSSSTFKFKDGNLYEGIGVPPDIAVKYDKSALQEGKDLQLEKAISLIP